MRENADAGAVLDEIRRYWAIIRWGRALGPMKFGLPDEADEADTMTPIGRSRHEFAQAAAHLNITRATFARLAASSDSMWHLLRGVVGCKAWLAGRQAGMRLSGLAGSVGNDARTVT